MEPDERWRDDVASAQNPSRHAVGYLTPLLAPRA